MIRIYWIIYILHVAHTRISACILLSTSWICLIFDLTLVKSAATAASFFKAVIKFGWSRLFYDNVHTSEENWMNYKRVHVHSVLLLVLYFFFKISKNLNALEFYRDAPRRLCPTSSRTCETAHNCSTCWKWWAANPWCVFPPETFVDRVQVEMWIFLTALLLRDPSP